MVCPHCQSQNADGANFCSNCGNRLELTCPTCGTPHEPGARFCSNCGTGLSAGPAPAQPPVPPRTASPTLEGDDLARYVPDELLRKIRAARDGGTMRGERRTVTMLFADIQGSTAAAEGMDPEEWADIMNGAFGHMIGPVYRYEGTLARLLGDAVLAFFGAPIAHEDDPVRAVLAGLEIVADMAGHQEEVFRRHGVELGVRVGINTGLVVVGEVGSDLRVEYTALGDAINLAARMEQTAEPGTVRVAEATFDLLGDHFESERIGAVDVKGKADPVVAHRILRVAHLAERNDASTSLVGRDDERRRLAEVVARAREGIGGVCTIVGEAGIGKSRLLGALRETIDRQAEVAERAAQDGEVAWLRGRSLAYDRTVPHATFVTLLRRWWELGESPDHGPIAEAVRRATGIEDADVVGYLAHLVKAPLPDAQRQLIDGQSVPVVHARMTEAVAAYVTAEARRRPLVMVFDDLHWADAMTLTLVERLMAVTDEAPLVLVVVLRPNREDPSWRVTEVAARDFSHRLVEMELEALREGSTEALLDQLLGDVALDDHLRSQILDRSNGNPLFIEEIVRSLGEGTSSEQHAIEVPRSLTGLLSSRLDHLDEHARHVAQVASVIGRDFDLDTLHVVADEQVDLPAQLGELLRRGILEERRRVPVAAYSFRHPLIQETAYNTVLLRTRRELHGRIAAHLESAHVEMPQEIARHHLEAGDTAAAFPHLVRAGSLALRAMALADAIRLFSSAIEAPPDDADRELVAASHAGLGEAYGMVPDLSRASATYQSLREFGRNAQTPSIEVMALNRLGYSTAALANDVDGAMAYLGQARALAEETGDEMGLAEYHMNACYVMCMKGDVESAVDHDAATARIGLDAGDSGIRLVGLVRQSANLVNVSRFAQAEAAYVEALEVARELGHEELEAVLHCTAGAPVLLSRGELRAAADLLARHLPTLDRHSSYYEANAAQWASTVALHSGDLERALTAAASAERAGLMMQQTYAIAVANSRRLLVLTHCGMAEDQAHLRTEAIERVDAPGGDFLHTTVWADLAQASLLAGDLGRAAADVARARGSTSMSTFWERPRLSLLDARLAMAHGDLGAASEHLDDARAEIARQDLRVVEPELLVLDGVLAHEEDRVGDALVLFGEADRASDEMGVRLVRVEALRRLADLHDRGGRTVEASASRRRALDVVGELAGLIASPELRDAFTRTWTDHVAAPTSPAPPSA